MVVNVVDNKVDNVVVNDVIVDDADGVLDDDDEVLIFKTCEAAVPKGRRGVLKTAKKI